MIKKINIFVILGTALSVATCYSTRSKPIVKTPVKSAAKKKLNFRQREKLRKEQATHKVAAIKTTNIPHRVSLIIDLESFEQVKYDISGLVDILYQVHQQASPLILSKNYFQAFSEYKKTYNAKCTDDLKASIMNAISLDNAKNIINKTYAGPEDSDLIWMPEDMVFQFLLVDFSDANWLAYKHNTADFILLIPKTIIAKNTTSKKPEEQLQSCGFNPKELTALSSVLPPVSEIPDKGLPGGFTSSLKKMFLPLSSDPSYWHIISSGHGIFGASNGILNPSASKISGIPLSEFNELVSFFNGAKENDINVQFFHYLGCFAGGSNLSLVNDHLASIKANFIIAAQGVNERVTFSDMLSFEQNPTTSKWYLKENSSFPTFFARLEDFFSNRKIKGDPLRYILEPLHDELGKTNDNTEVLVRIPKVGTFQAVKASSAVSILTKGIVKAHEFEDKPIDFSKSTVKHILNYAQRIDVPLILTEESDTEQKNLILQPPPLYDDKPYARLYIFDTVFNQNESLNSFIDRVCKNNASFLPITILIKKIHTAAGLISNLILHFKHIPEFKRRSYNVETIIQYCHSSAANNDYSYRKELAKNCLRKEDFDFLNSAQQGFISLSHLVDFLDNALAQKLEPTFVGEKDGIRSRVKKATTKDSKRAIGALKNAGNMQAKIAAALTRLEGQISNTNMIDHQNSNDYSPLGLKEMVLSTQEQAIDLSKQIDPGSTLQDRLNTLLTNITSLLGHIDTIFTPIYESLTIEISPELATKIVLFLIQYADLLNIPRNYAFIIRMLERGLLDRNIGSIWHATAHAPRTAQTIEALTNLSVAIPEHYIGDDPEESNKQALLKIKTAQDPIESPIDRDVQCLTIMKNLAEKKRLSEIAVNIAQNIPINITTIFALSSLYGLLIEQRPDLTPNALYFTLEAISKITNLEAPKTPPRRGVDRINIFAIRNKMIELLADITNYYQALDTEKVTKIDIANKIDAVINWLESSITLQEKSSRMTLSRDESAKQEIAKQKDNIRKISTKISLLREQSTPAS
jgi:hypothetical protein